MTHYDSTTVPLPLELHVGKSMGQSRESYTLRAR